MHWFTDNAFKFEILPANQNKFTDHLANMFSAHAHKKYLIRNKGETRLN